MNELVRGGTFCTTKASLAIGNTATAVSYACVNGAGIDFAINGLMYFASQVATNADDVLTVHPVQAVDTSCIYLICMSAASTPVMTSVKGTAVTTTDLTKGHVVLEWPKPTINTCPVAAFRIDTGASNSFTTGTDDLDNTGNTVTYYDLCAVPAAPLAS